MKKVLAILSILLILFFVFERENNKEIRIRVVANSNSYVDQNIKNDVVGIVKSVINANDTKDEVVSKMEILNKKIKQYENSNNVSIKVEFRKTNFPAKSLNDKVIPAGVYETVLITIGNGKGNNYWTLLYPEFYNITFEDIDSENIIYRSYISKLFKKVFN